MILSSFLVFIFFIYPTITQTQEYKNVIINSSDDIYKLLEGTWHSPPSAELDVVFSIIEDGNFTIMVNPVFEYSNLSTTDQSIAIEANISEEQGFFNLLSFLENNSKVEGVMVEMEIFLNNEYSTNIIDITQDKLYIYDKQNNEKFLFICR